MQTVGRIGSLLLSPPPFLYDPSAMHSSAKLLVALLLAWSCSACGRAKAPDAPGVRVVSLAPSLTEIVCAVGASDLLVGRTSACDYPPDVVTNVTVIGEFGKPSLERLLAQSPTLVLSIDLADETVGKKIETLGLHRERIRCRSLDDIPSAVEKVGVLLDRSARASELAARIKKDVDTLRAEAGRLESRPTVYIETWHDPPWTAGKNTFLSELVWLAGGRNIADEIDKEHFQASAEWVLSKNPDIILCLYMSIEGSAKDVVLNRPGWKDVAAVRNGKVFDGFNNDLLLRPGPRVVEGIRELKERISQ